MNGWLNKWINPYEIIECYQTIHKERERERQPESRVRFSVLYLFRIRVSSQVLSPSAALSSVPSLDPNGTPSFFPSPKPSALLFQKQQKTDFDVRRIESRQASDHQCSQATMDYLHSTSGNMLNWTVLTSLFTTTLLFLLKDTSSSMLHGKYILCQYGVCFTVRDSFPSSRLKFY